MKKYVILTSLILIFFVFIIGMVIGEATLSRQRDFSGRVSSLEKTEEGYKLVCDGEFGGSYVFLITDRSSLLNLFGEHISLYDIKEGGKILLDMNKPLFGDSNEVKELIYFTDSEKEFIGVKNADKN